MHDDNKEQYSRRVTKLINLITEFKLYKYWCKFLSLARELKLPAAWAERLTLVKKDGDGSVVGVESRVHDIITPPAWEVCVCQLQTQENDHQRVGQSDIQTGRERIVVLKPPVSKSLLDEDTEEHTDNTVSRVVVWGSWRNVTGTREEDRPVQPSNLRVWPFLQNQPVNNWQQSQKEKEKSLVVDSTITEDSLWTNGTPNNRGVEEHSTVRTGVSTGLTSNTQVVNGTVRPSQNTNLDKGTPKGSQQLGTEQKTWRHLHVVTQLHVLGKSNSLVVGDVTEGLEEHHGQWLTWNHVTNNELGNDVQSHCDVGQRVNNTDGQQEDNGDDKSDD